MQKKIVASFVDILIPSVILSILVYVALNGIIGGETFEFTLALSALITFTILWFFFPLLKKRFTARVLSATGQKKQEAVFYNLPYLTEVNMLTYFMELFIHNGYFVKKYRHHLIIEKNGVRKLVLCRFNTKEISDETVSEAVRQYKQRELSGCIVLCNDASHAAISTFNTVKTDFCAIITKRELYKAMENYGVFPDTVYSVSNKKRPLRDVFKYAFKRERFKGFFFLAVVMLLFSYVTPFRTYYLLFAAFLALLSLICLFNGRKITKTDNTDNIFIQ